MTTSPLLISLDRRSRTPVYRQVYELFRRRILRGELRAGEPVPSSRDLARMLGISRLPVLNAYAQLLAEGYFETRRGDGTYVAPSLSRPARLRPRGASPICTPSPSRSGRGSRPATRGAPA